MNIRHLAFSLFLFPIFCSLALSQPRSQAGNATASVHYASDLTALLAQVVTNDGLVKYTELANRNAAFNSILRAIETQDVSKLRTDAEKMAFWINAYNVLMLKNILDNPRVHDIFAANKADAFFKTPRLVAQQSLSLDQIENQILRRQNGGNASLKVSVLDPRLHAALNCAARSCPRLQKLAFTPQNLHQTLENAMRTWVNSSQFVKIEGNVLKISSLLQWFGKDFDMNNQKAGDFLLKYVNRTHPNKALLTEMLRGKDGQALSSLSRLGNKTVQYEYIWAVNRAQ